MKGKENAVYIMLKVNTMRIIIERRSEERKKKRKESAFFFKPFRNEKQNQYLLVNKDAKRRKQI